MVLHYPFSSGFFVKLMICHMHLTPFIPLSRVRGVLKPKAAEDLQAERKQLVFKPLPLRGRGWGEVFDGKYEVGGELFVT